MIILTFFLPLRLSALISIHTRGRHRNIVFCLSAWSNPHPLSHWHKMAFSSLSEPSVRFAAFIIRRPLSSVAAYSRLCCRHAGIGSRSYFEIVTMGTASTLSLPPASSTSRILPWLFKVLGLVRDNTWSLLILARNGKSNKRGEAWGSSDGPRARVDLAISYSIINYNSGTLPHHIHTYLVENYRHLEVKIVLWIFNADW